MIYSILLTLFIVPFFISLFFLTGKYMQSRFGIFSNNNFMALPLGFIVFTVITIAVYTPLTILHLSGIVYVVIECLKDLAIFVFIWLNRKWIKLKFNWLKIIGVILGAIMIAAIPGIITLLKDNNDYAFRWNQDYNLYGISFAGAFEFEPWKNNNIYNAWFMFNSVIIFLFKINGDFELWWVQGIIMGFVILTTLLSLFRIMFKKIKFTALITIAIMVIIISLLTANAYGLNSNMLGVVASALILMIVSWNLMKTPKVRLFLLSGFSGVSIMFFDWSALWIYAAYMLIFIGVYILKQKPKPTLLILFSLTFIGFIFAASIHRFSSIGSSIGMILAVFIGVLFTWLRNKNIEVPMDRILYRFRKWWMPLLFIILFISSTILWATKQPLNQWLDFEIDPRFLNVLSDVKHLDVTMYAFYWILLVAAIVVVTLELKKKKRLEVDVFFILIGLLSTIFFFSPFTASLIKEHLAPGSLFESIQWVTMLPLVLGFVLKITRFIRNKIGIYNGTIQRRSNV